MSRSSQNPRLLMLIALVIGFALRALLALSTEGNFDIQSFRTQADIARSGGNVYAEFRYYNYSPVWLHVVGGVSIVSDALHIAFPAAVRLFLSLVDVLNALLIAAIARQPKALLIYFLNPVGILLVGYGGQFEVLALLPLLTAVWLHQRGGNAAGVWALGTLTILIKHLTLFGVWMLFIHAFGWRKGVIRFIASAAIFGLSFSPYLPGGAEGIYRNVLRYASEVGFYGFGMLLPTGFSSALMWMMLLIGIPLLAHILKLQLPEAMLLSSVGMLAFMYGFAEPYLMLVLVWAAIYPSRWLNAFTVASLIYILLAPWQAVGEFMQKLYGNYLPFSVYLSNMIWLVTLGWVGWYGVKAVIKPVVGLASLLAEYPTLTILQRAHMTIRWMVCPLSRLLLYVPQRGVILDLGCGHGLFSLLMARSAPTRAVIGIDLDQEKIKLANTLQQRNLRFIAGDIAKQDDLPLAQVVTIVDVFYLVPFEAQERLLQLCKDRLASDGVILLKDMAEAPRWKVWLNWLEETLAVRVLGITESTESRFYFRPRAEWVALFEKLGFSVEVVPMDNGYYHPHVVFVATLNSH